MSHAVPSANTQATDALPPASDKEAPGAGPPDGSATVVNSFLSLGGGAMASRVVAFVGTAYLARVLGPAGFGIVALALAISKYVSLAVDGGLSAVGAREVARRPERAPDLAASLVALRLLLAGGGIVVIGLVAWFLPKPPSVKLVLFLMGLTYFSFALNTSWVHKGLEKNRRVGLAMVLTEALFLGLVLLLVTAPSDVVFVPVALFLSQLGAAVYLGYYLFYRRSFRADLREALGIFRRSSYLIGSRLMRTLFFTVDVLLLSFFIGERAVGLYDAPYRVCFVILALAMATLYSYLPVFTRAANAGGPAQVSAVATRSLEFSVAFTLPAVVGGILLAAPLLTTLFGPEYAEGALAFQLLLPGTGLALLWKTVQNVLLAYDRLRTDMWITVAGTALNIVLNLVLIPYYGLAGAALATLLAEALSLGLGFFVIYRMRVRPTLHPLLRSAGATAVMALALLLAAPYLHTLASVALGVVVYAGALLLVRGVPEDAQPLLRAARARLPLG